MKGIAAATIVLLCLSLPGAAAPTLNDTARGQRLDDLFQQLKTAPTQSAALAAEQQISDIWLDSGDPDVNRQMHVAMQAMDELFYDSALKVFTNIIVVRPDYIEGWNKRATLYYLVGDYQDSLSDIDRVLALEPRHFGAIAGKGMVLLKLGRQEDALAAFKQALAIDPALSNIEMEIELLQAQQAQKRP